MMDTRFGALLRILRTRVGLKLQNLAEHLGVTASYMGEVETGRRTPLTIPNLLLVAQKLRVTPYQLLRAKILVQREFTLSWGENVENAGPKLRVAALLAAHWGGLSDVAVRRLQAALEPESAGIRSTIPWSQERPEEGHLRPGRAQRFTNWKRVAGLLRRQRDEARASAGREQLDRQHAEGRAELLKKQLEGLVREHKNHVGCVGEGLRKEHAREGNCRLCGILDCPGADPDHYAADGCPSCDFEPSITA